MSTPNNSTTIYITPTGQRERDHQIKVVTKRFDLDKTKS